MGERKTTFIDIKWMRRTRKTLPPSLKLKLFFIEMPP